VLEIALPYGLLTKDLALEILDLPPIRRNWRKEDYSKFKQYRC
jgi:hypothetical protein